MRISGGRESGMKWGATRARSSVGEIQETEMTPAPQALEAVAARAVARFGRRAAKATRRVLEPTVLFGARDGDVGDDPGFWRAARPVTPQDWEAGRETRLSGVVSRWFGRTAE